MITEFDLQEAIAECEGERNPTSHTCIKLAAFLTLQHYMYGKKEEEEEVPAYSRAIGPVVRPVEIEGDSEFANAVRGRDPSEIMPVVEELMEALEVLNPRLYRNAIDKFRA